MRAVTLLVVLCLGLGACSGEPSARESRSDDEEYEQYFEEERGRVAGRGPLEAVATLGEDI